MNLIKGPYEKCIEHCIDDENAECFVFDFPYVSISEYFREINRFLWESKHQFVRFKNCYSGKAIVDITAWNKSSPNEYFDAFLYFLKDRESSIDCTFISEPDYSEIVLERINRLFLTNIVPLDSNCSPTVSRIGFVITTEEER